MPMRYPAGFFLSPSRACPHSTYDQHALVDDAPTKDRIEKFRPPFFGRRRRYDSEQQLQPMVIITSIEVHHVDCEFHDWLHYVLSHYHEGSDRTIYVVHTDTGLVGLGESGGDGESQEVIDSYIGTSPWQHLGDKTSLGLGTAMYDLMGQDAGVPCWQLFGQQVRRWTPVGSWTVSSDPAHMAEAVQRYAAQGFTWMKYHLSPFFNVFDQMDAIQAVAPKDFQIHLDFTFTPLENHVGMCDQLAERYPCVGCFEDSFEQVSLDKYKEFKLRAKKPVVLHHAPMGFTTEVSMGVADIYMMGHSHIGKAVEASGHFAACHAPFMLQNVGGAITLSMVSHMMSAFPTATFKCHTDCEVYKYDVVNERAAVQPINGFIRVGDRPGLGLTLNRAELERMSKPRGWKPGPFPRFIIRTRFTNGAAMWFPFPMRAGNHVMPQEHGGPPMRYDALCQTDYWDDDGTAEWAEVMARCEKDGEVLEFTPRL